MLRNIEVVELQMPDKHGQDSFDSRLLNSMKLKEDDDVYEFLKNKRHLAKLVDGLGRTLLHYAAEYGCHRTVSLLAFKSEIDRKDCQGKSAFALATTTETINFLLGDNDFADNDFGGRIDWKLSEYSRKRWEERGYHYSLTNMELGVNASEIAKKLIDFNYSIFSVIKFRRAEVTRLMLEHGSPLVDRNSSLGPPDVLTFAIKSNDFENARVLIDYGIDVNAENSKGQTPLSSFTVRKAVNRGQRLDILRRLLNEGTNPTKIIRNVKNDYEYKENVTTGEMQIAAILRYDDREIIRVLLNNTNIDLNARDAHGCTAIHYMASNSQPGVFKELKEKEYDANARDNKGSTPLHLIESCNFNTARALHLRGADVNAVDNNGMTVLMRILKNGGCRRCTMLSLKIREARVIEYLLCHGANPQVIATRPQFSIFFYAFNSEECHRLRPMLIQLSISEASGTPIVDDVNNEINDRTELKNIFNNCKKELEKMKKIKIFKSISVYDLLICSDDKIEQYLRDKQFHLKLHRMRTHIRYFDYFTYFLRNRIEKAIQVKIMREQMTAVLSKILNLDQLVAAKITSYFSEADLRKSLL